MRETKENRLGGGEIEGEEGREGAGWRTAEGETGEGASEAEGVDNEREICFRGFFFFVVLG